MPANVGVPAGLGSAVAVAGGGVAVDGGVAVGRGASWEAALQETPTHMAMKSAVERTIRDGVEDMPMLSDRITRTRRVRTIRYWPLAVKQDRAVALP
jgi:hypothetical protein